MEGATAMKLYEMDSVYARLCERHLALMVQIEEAGGVITPEQEAELNEIVDALGGIIEEADAKVLNIARMIESRSVEIAAYKAEEARLSEISKAVAVRRKRLEKSNEFFEQYILRSLELMDKKEVSDRQTCLKVNESKSCALVNENEVPPEYLRAVHLTLESGPEARTQMVNGLMNLLSESGCCAAAVLDVDKARALYDLRRGHDVPGCKIEVSRKLKIS